MTAIENSLPYDDGFNEFVNDRTGKTHHRNSNDHLTVDTAIENCSNYTKDVSTQSKTGSDDDPRQITENCMTSNVENDRTDDTITGSIKNKVENDLTNDTITGSIKSKVEDDHLDETMAGGIRSEGSGSENGAEHLRPDHDWYNNELREKVSRSLTASQPAKRPGSGWRCERMESFESNKEFVGSEGRNSPLSYYSPAHKADGSSDYPTCSSRGAGDFEDDDWEAWERPTGERWPPLGAPNDEDGHSICSFEELGRSRAEPGRLKELEEEQEQLNTSLMSLTSHFAQVQFRLKQIINAEPDEKERLLKELEEFADRGIPDLRAIEHTRQAVRKCSTTAALTEQRELIERLKEQLDELEQYAYRTGEAGLPQTELVTKQKVIIDQLKGKLPLDVEDLGQLTVEDLRSQVDTCVKQLVNPLKMKEQLVSQLQTQIGDLERFIDFLQDDDQRKIPPGLLSPSKCECGGHGDRSSSPTKAPSVQRPSKLRPRIPTVEQEKKQLREDTARLMDRATLLLSMLRFAQLGCGSAPRSRPPSASAKGYHWGDLRANLELAIATLVEQVLPSTSEYTSDSDVGPLELQLTSRSSSQQVTLIVRKQFVPALRDLIHHGLIPPSSGRSLVSAWSCFPSRSPPSQLLHAWDLVLQYYQLKRGDHYNTTPARRLSQASDRDYHKRVVLTPLPGDYHRRVVLTPLPGDSHRLSSRSVL
ncbi:hypothetical protein FHG87_013035 [Trinorchestia longiramus]|nr:hypothetical protein FHG87_013035 [Trinorchestia longiramus]